MKISSVAQMRSLDHAAISTLGIPEEILMENAGIAAVHLLSHKLGTPLQQCKIIIFCGSGNNGGDGMVIARILTSMGSQIHLVFLSDASTYKNASRINYEMVKKIDIPAINYNDISSPSKFITDFDLVIDAMLGTGIARPLTGDYLSAVNTINTSQLPVLSVDIPSGVHGDSGQILGDAVKATWTVTFGLPKTGNLLYPGYQYNGELFVSHISFPPILSTKEEILVEINSPLPLPTRNPAGHKSSFGQALIIAGAASYLGAPYFAAMSYLKAGGGYSRLATPKSIAPFIAQKGSEIVFHPMIETRQGGIALINKVDLIAIADDMDFVIVGPGTSLEAETQNLVCDLVSEITVPVLIDGDGLSALCANLALVKNREAPTILTPHLGEMARLTEKSVAEIKSDPISLLQHYCEKWSALIVLKGAHTLIGLPDKKVFINMSGNAGMATAGSGDVLTGTIAAMYGIGLTIEESVRSGVFIHGLAGDLAADKLGMDGLTAQDILTFLPEALKIHRDRESWEVRYKGYKGAIEL